MKVETLRLFFALDCPAPLAECIASWREGLRLRANPVAPANLHLTLAFLGQQPAECLAQLRALAAAIAAPRFELCLDRLKRRRNGLLYLAPSQPPAALKQLADDLQQRLLARGFDLDNRPFFPHLTLARRCHRLDSQDQPSFDWPVKDFVLMASELGRQGPEYHRLGRWPLLPND